MIKTYPLKAGIELQAEALCDLVVTILEDMKAQDIKILDVRGKTSITDFFIVASGTSDRHVKATAETLIFKAKQQGAPTLGSEGIEDGEWALVDLNDVVVHIMLPRVRDYYQLERLWSLDPAKESIDLGAGSA